MPFPLHLCEVLSATNGFLKGQGEVMFPELLSRTEPIDRQAFGLVFIDRLTGLYLQRVVAVRNAVNLHAEDLGGDPAILRRRRQVAFMAHEWGRLDKALPRLRDELGIVKAMESASSRGPGSAEDYLSKQGRVLSDNRYHLELSDDLSTRLSTASASL